VLVKLKRLPHCFALPKYKTRGAAGADVYVTELAKLTPGCVRKIPLGFCVEIPLGYEGTLRPRSSLCKSNIIGITGTIDSDYRGEVYASLVYLGPWIHTINRGERIAQLVISPLVGVHFEEFPELSETTRGDGGFGSTGK
jgi:dUTP pyrophosphatase